MSFVSTYIGVIGLGAGLPALALVAGYPKQVTDGLGSPMEKWNASKEARLGLNLYTTSDILLGGLCAVSWVMPNEVTPTTALCAIACHQFGYLASAIPAFGYRPQQLPSFLVGTISVLLAWASRSGKFK